MNHKEALLSLLTAEEIAKHTTSILTEIWESGSERDNEAMGPYLTLGDFKKLDGFYASKNIMKEMVAIFVGRVARFYSIKYPTTSTQTVMEVFEEAEEAEWKAIELMKEFFTVKYGPVSEERIKELDKVGASWQALHSQMLSELVTGKKN